MFHGTGKGGDTKKILSTTDGIDMRWSHHGGAHGYGCYFAHNASYSNSSTYCYTNPEGFRILIVCWVFPGLTTNDNQYLAP